MVPHIIHGNGTISLMLDGVMKPVDTAHPNYDVIKDALKNGEWDKIPELVNIVNKVEEAIKSATSGNINIKDGEILYGTMPIHNTLTERILRMIDEGFEVSHMIKFLDNLMQNPSRRAVMELYDFLEAGGIPITENGTFLTYKKIRNDWTDIYTGTMDNSIGATVEMPRNMVDEDSDRTCSYGLHVCSYDYLSHFGSSGNDRVIICEICPSDVVAIPKDYNNTKMRVCKYKVIGEVEDYKENEVLADSVVVETSNFPTPEEIAAEKSKELTKDIGYHIVDIAENQELHGLEILAERIAEIMEDYTDMIDIGRIEDGLASNPTKIGKWVARTINKVGIDEGTYNDIIESLDNFMELDAEEVTPAEEIQSGTPVTDTVTKCTRCGSTNINDNNRCEDCGLYL